MKRRGSTKTSPPTKIAKLSDDEELSELREADYEGFLVPDIDKGQPKEFEDIILSAPEWDYTKIDIDVDDISKTNADATIWQKKQKKISFIGRMIDTKKQKSILDEIEFYRAAQWGKKEITLKQTIMYLEDSQPSKVYQIGRIVEIFKKASGAFVTVHPFYRHADIVQNMNNRMTYDDKEVYLEHNVDKQRFKVIVDMQNIEELCHVLFLNNTEQFSVFRGRRGIFYCRYTYDKITGIMRNIHSDYLRETFDNWTPVAKFLQDQVYQYPPDKVPVVLDAFCGTGGLSLGFHQRGKHARVINIIGCHIAYAVDIHEAAARTFQKNFPTCKVFNQDVEQFLRMLKVVDKLRKTYIPHKKTDEPKEIITKVRTHPNASHRFQFYVKNKRWCNDEDFADLGDVGHFVEKTFAHYPGPKTVDILIGGPPCQGFSPLARNSTKDLTTDKNRYLTVFLALVDFLKPKYVLIENVPNMLSSKAPLVINKFFNDINYNVHMGELNATQFGLPQMRARVFVWACSGGRKFPKFPRPQYAYQRNTATIKESRRFLVAQPGLNIGAPLPSLNLRDFLSDLPVNDDNTLEKDLNYAKEPMNMYQDSLRKTPAMSKNQYVTMHQAVNCSNKTKLKIEKLPRESGAKALDFLPPAEWQTIGKGTVGSRTQENFFRRLCWEGIVGTITTQPDPYLGQAIHPYANRPLTVRERARLQGFPDSFEFLDTAKDAQRHVGNAVPVFVANAIAFEFGKAWVKALGKERPPEGTQATLEALIGLEQSTQDMVFYTQGNALDKLVKLGWPKEIHVHETYAADKHLADLFQEVAPILRQNAIVETTYTKNNRKEVEAYLVDNNVKKAPKTPSPEKGPKQQQITGFFNVVEKTPEPKPVPKKKSTLTIKKRGNSAGKT